MKQPKFCVVVTTINGGDFLQGYCDAANVEEVRENVSFVVIPDRKTPASLYEKCQVAKAAGLDVACPTLEEQDAFLAKTGPFKQLVPYNSDDRRNIGFLIAIESEANVLVSLDDDNYCLETERAYNAYASVVGDEVTMPTVHSSTGWFNLCELLSLTPPNLTVYPRGFPHHKRHKPTEITYTQESGVVRLNAGLWLTEPDLDAITWLVAPVRASAFVGQSMLLGSGTWTPINTQNTSMHRDLIAAYYYIRMGYPLAGIPIDRYGDILSGYLVQACVRHMGHRIRIGSPIADHRRNSHNYLRDMASEMACMLALEEFTAWLPEANLQGATYEEAYLSLAAAIEDQVERFTGFIWQDATRGYFHQMAYCMRQWINACKMIK